MNRNRDFTGSCIERYLLIAILPTLFLLFLGLNLFHVINIVHIYAHTFYITLGIYLIFLLFMPHNAFVAVCKIRNNFDITRNELEISLEKSAITIDGKTKSVLSVRDFLEEYFKNLRNDHFAKIASSTFPMLGILGTFVAIAISMPDFTVNSTQELDSEISTLLAGVGTAFYASIYGIFLSLLWTFFERLGLSGIEKITLALEDLYTNHIWSKKELLKFQYNQKTLMENELINALKSAFNLDFIKELNREHLASYEKMITITNSTLSSLENGIKRSALEIEESIAKIDSANDTLEARLVLEENLAEFNKSAKELHKLLLSFDNGLDRALHTIDSELASAVKHIEEMVKVVKEN